MQDNRPPCLIFWIGYYSSELGNGHQLAPHVRKLLRDIVCRALSPGIEGERDVYDVDSITDFDGRRIGYGVVLNRQTDHVVLSEEPCFVETWLDELGGPLRQGFDKTYEPGVYVTIGRVRS